LIYNKYKKAFAQKIHNRGLHIANSEGFTAS